MWCYYCKSTYAYILCTYINKQNNIFNVLQCYFYELHQANMYKRYLKQMGILFTYPMPLNYFHNNDVVFRPIYFKINWRARKLSAPKINGFLSLMVNPLSLGPIDFRTPTQYNAHFKI